MECSKSYNQSCHISHGLMDLDFPCLDLRQYKKWDKLIKAIKFIPIAFKTIEQKRIQPKYTYHMLDRNSEILGMASGDVCYPVKLDEKDMICRLLVEFEDRRFFSHHGIDVFSIAKALTNNLTKLRIVRGGSTITQQLIRNTILTPDRSFVRKITEIFLALKFEKHYTKSEILFLYSQLVYLGNGVRGFQAASKLIYRKPINKLNKYLSCGIIGLLRRPSLYYPSNNLDNYLKRQAFINNIHKIRHQEEDEKHESDLLFKSPNPIRFNNLGKPRWTHVVNKLLKTETHFQNYIYSQPLKIGLTIDRKYQNILDSVICDASLNNDIIHAAGVIIDNKTSDILAESSWTYGKEWDFSPTFFGSLQPGSTFKTFAYLTALENGFDSDFQLDSSKFKSRFIKNNDGSYWQVRNYANIYRGNIKLIDAFKHSDNSAFARLAELLDLNMLKSTYHNFHLCEKENITPAIVLGASTKGISLLDLASAYATIARNGIYKKPRLIKYYQDINENLFHFPLLHEDLLLIRNYTNLYDLKFALRQSATLLKGLNFSGKTGTTKTSSLFAGYNDNVSVAIWLNHDYGRKENDHKAITALKVVEQLAKKLLGHKHDVFTI